MNVFTRQQVSDDGIEQITFNCRMLRTFYVANCPKVQPRSIMCAPINQVGVARLQMLVPSALLKVVPTSLNWTCQAVPSRKSVSPPTSAQHEALSLASDRSLSLLRKFSSNLRRLDILCCPDITRYARAQRERERERGRESSFPLALMQRSSVEAETC